MNRCESARFDSASWICSSTCCASGSAGVGEGGAESGDAAPQLRDLGGLRLELALEIRHGELLRDDGAEACEPGDGGLHVLRGDTQLDVGGAVAALRRAVVDRLGVAAERRRDSRRLRCRGGERVGVVDADLEGRIGVRRRDP